MFYSKDVRKALAIAYQAHAGQFDLGGTPFIFHPLHVAFHVPDEDDRIVIIALLHDVLEKTKVTANELLATGFSREIVEVVEILTYDQEEPYFDYIRRIKENPLARTVALSAVYHNLDTERFKGRSFTGDEYDAIEELLEGYEDAYRILEED